MDKSNLKMMAEKKPNLFSFEYLLQVNLLTVNGRSIFDVHFAPTEFEAQQIQQGLVEENFQ